MHPCESSACFHEDLLRLLVFPCWASDQVEDQGCQKLWMEACHRLDLTTLFACFRSRSHQDRIQLCLDTSLISRGLSLLPCLVRAAAVQESIVELVQLVHHL